MYDGTSRFLGADAHMTAVAMYRPEMTWAIALLLAMSLLSVVGYDLARRDCQTRYNYMTG